MSARAPTTKANVLGARMLSILSGLRRPQTVLARRGDGVNPASGHGQSNRTYLLKAMAQHMDLKGKRILFPRSSLPNPFLKDALSVYGAIVEEIIIYGNTKPAKRDLPSAGIDGVIFTSPSTVQNFLNDYGTIPAPWQIMAKGPVTLKTLQDAGYHHATSLS